MMNVQRLAVVKIVPNSMKPKELRNVTMSGEYRKIAKRTCRAVKYPMESTSAAASSRATLGSPDFTEAVKAVEACRAARGRLATFRTVLQSLSSARTGTTHPADCSFCAKRAMRIECPPASANPSSNPNGVSNTARQIDSTSSHSGSVPVLETGALTSPSPVSCALAGVSQRLSSVSGPAFLNR